MSVFDGVYGTVCNAEQYQLSVVNKTITCLTHGQSIGLAVSILLSVARFTLGGIFDVRWAHNGIVTVGPYCTAQGIIQQSGELGVALITLILTVHTFVVALWKVGIGARRIAFGMVAIASLFVALWVGIGNGIHKNFETPTPYWCWIGPEYGAERLAGEYIWLWIALFASVIMVRLSVDPERWYKFRLSESDDGYTQRRSALGMLSYPLAYSFVVLPVSIARWLVFSNKKVPSAAAFFAVSMFNLSGAINVLLFLIVRPGLLLFSPPEEFGEPEGAEVEDPTTGSTMFPDTPKYSHSPQPTGMSLADDADDGAWNLTADGNNVALSRIDSRTRSDGI
ncbi:hypothetical protein EDB83DRAFT_2309432 [Lactarius deliciosus]|nr:hypothetical protein EDB83DRAFT_2309432 [Lactarius deliciosus]